ncbi:unnamed protein product [Vicia faba]|uniref:Uncharacterized protein n=1 Tax=Vicia faba TaxID=3906 RepID=A0AAV1AMD0_VICFA|nr:unnamed protein product [Vicia faba]
MDKLHQQGPWCLIGDFNNVLKSQDIIGGSIVTEAECSDLQDFMDNNNLLEMDLIGDYYTWSNKHFTVTIYSSIDGLLANVDWFYNHLNSTLRNLPPLVSDHSLLYLASQPRVEKHHTRVRFVYCVTDVDGYTDMVKDSWNTPLVGRPMYVLWNKLRRVEPVLYKMHKSLILAK